jgi:hypothetical protein
MPSDQERLEEIRYAVRAHLYDRQGVSQSAGTIRRNLSREIRDLTDAEIEDACRLLVDLDQVAIDTSELGSTRYYRITAAGILAHERTR